jgi:hypothetical protein
MKEWQKSFGENILLMWRFFKKSNGKRVFDFFSQKVAAEFQVKFLFAMIMI